MTLTTSERADAIEEYLELRAEQQGVPKWERMPHQIPPSGDWFMWLLEAGRGIGKTAAAAHYITEHVAGPPCISKSLPHRIGLIAPTLGDAIESADLNDMAITRIDPSATFTASAGGAMVKWPNGSQLRLFGTNTKRDTDRLRAGGNRSLAVGTLIETELGPRRIETVMPGDLVYTAGGLRPVVGRWNHGYRELWRIETESGRTLTLTPDHEVWTPEGWERCDSLTVGSNIAVWNGTDTAGRNSETDTGHVRSSETVNLRRCSCTAWSTKRPLALSLMVTSFITSIMTRATTGLKTSSRYHIAITTPNIIQDGSGMPLVGAPRNGTRSLSKTANSAAQSSRDTATRGSAPRNAGVGSRQRTPQPSVCEHASCATHLSTVLPGPPPSLVPDRVATISRGNAVGLVWDLTVAGEHAFVADGIYVANCLYWLEELASWPRMSEAWEMMMFGLRLGPKPRVIATTTPKPRPEYIEIRETADHITNAETADNPHLNEEQKRRLYLLYGDTSLGEQELKGKLIDEAEGALWDTKMIDDDRLPDLLYREDEYGDEIESWQPLGRGVVAVDPPGGATEAGIVAAALIPDCPCGGDRMPHFAVVDDRSGKLTPEGWGSRAVSTLHDWEFDRIVGETNYGGDMVESIIRQHDANIPYKEVHASRGKRIRAEPIKALYEQHRVHHIGTFPLLEAQMVLWEPDKSEWSPDRIDALVWALTDLASGRLLDGNLMV